MTRIDGDYFEKAEEFLGSCAGRALFAHRKTVIEGIFGQSKSLHGLSRAKMRGLEKVEIQALMTATAVNLKKLVNCGIKRLVFEFLNSLKSLRRSDFGDLDVSSSHFGNRPDRVRYRCWRSLIGGEVGQLLIA